jgi:hypothetical protein
MNLVASLLFNIAFDQINCVIASERTVAFEFIASSLKRWGFDWFAYFVALKFYS